MPVRARRAKKCAVSRSGDRHSFQAEGLERRFFLSSAIAAFGPAQTFAAGTSAFWVATGDVNLDGHPDLIVANLASNSVSVLLGNGNGTFQTQTTVAVGIQPHFVTVADLNGDGKPDLIVPNYGSNSVSVLLGNGNGTFQNQATFATGSEPQSVVVSDFNGDGKPDLVIADFGNGTVSVLLGNGNGTFQNQVTFATASEPVGIATADVNGDGKTDLAVCNYSGSVSVLLGNGNGTFDAPATFAAAGHPRWIVAGDLNGDGKPDLATSNAHGNNVSVLLGNGNGTFQNQSTFAVGANAQAIALADVNSDGKPDLLTANFASNSVSVLLGNGDGTFQSQVTFVAGANPQSIVTSDVNGDGRLDLVVADRGGGSVGVLLGDVPPTVLSINRTGPPGPFTSDNSVSFTVTFNESVTGVDSSDFSVVTNGGVSTSGLAVFPVSNSVYTATVEGISGTGTIGLNLVDNGSIHDAAGNPLQPGGVAAFQPQQTFAVGYPSSMSVADVNGDGKPDLIIAKPNISTVSVLLGNGNGTFQNPLTVATSSGPNTVTTADLNGDGKADLITANYSSGTVSVLLGNGNGTFQNQVTFAAGSHPSDVAVADVNVDGKPDLIVSNAGDNSVSVLLGNGNGTFQPQQTFAVGLHPSFVAVSDANGDGKPDLVVANINARSVSVLLGNGNGTFQNQNTFVTALAPISVVVSDVNGDGKADLIVASNTNLGSVGVLLGNGNGTFQNQQTFSTGSFPRVLAVADLNGDGKPDLITPNLFSNSVSVLLGNGNGTFQNQTTFAVGSEPFSVIVSDANGDGRADLIVTNSGSNNVSVLLGNSNGNFTGQTYTIVPSLDTISGTAGVDQITLMQDPDSAHIDWTLNGSGPTQMAITDPNGLTINGNGGNDVMTLNYANGNPLPNTLHLNGTFMLNGLSGSFPLANTNLDIERSTVYISYTASDPISLIKGYLATGYNNGAWNGGAIPAVQSIAATGYNADVIAEAGAANAQAGTSTDFGGNYVWYEQGYPGSAGTGLPASGSTFTSAANPNVRFTLQPYTANNVAFIPGGNGSVTLTLTNPASYGALSFLAAAANGSAEMTATLNFADSSTVSVPITVSDWFNGNNAAVVAGGRIIRSTSSTVELDGANPRMYEYDYDVPGADQNKLLNSITFTQTSGNQLGIFAISGAAASPGAITSSAAAANAAHTTGIGYADSADGQGVNNVANTIELTYTLYGDANLDHQVNSADLQILLFSLNRPGAWDQGDFNYDGQVNSADLQALLFTLNTSLGNQATPMAVVATPAPTTTATRSGSDSSPHLMPAINPTGLTTVAVSHPHPAKVAAKKRR